MASRIELQTKLEEILGTENVYFQPPESYKMVYPCIRYQLNNVATESANNGNYKVDKSYSVMLIHKDPDNTIVDEILKLPMCKFDRFYTANNLNHYVFTLYF